MNVLSERVFAEVLGCVYVNDSTNTLHGCFKSSSACKEKHKSVIKRNILSVETKLRMKRNILLNVETYIGHVVIPIITY